MSDSLQHRVTRLDELGKGARYHGGLRTLADIRYIVAHATAGDTFASSMEWLNRDKAGAPKGTPLDKKDRASYTYGIDRDGSIWRAAAPEVVTYHAGDSGFPAMKYPPGNHTSLNRTSLGIAWANRGDGEPLTPEQIESGLWLYRVWMDKLWIPPSRVLGHYEVSPGRKKDPRPAIDMKDWREMLAEFTPPPVVV